MGIALLLAATAALFAATPGSVWAGTTFQPAPLNPDFVEYMENQAEERSAGELHLTSEGYALGCIPSPFDRSHLKAPVQEGRFPLGFPDSYDPVSYTHLDVYKRQPWCWL